MTFLLIANRDEAEPSASMWDDLRPCLWALAAFGEGRPVHLGWSGAVAPTGVPDVVRAIELPRHLSDWQARQHLAAHMDPGPLFLVGDRVVIGPDTMEAIRFDLRAVAQAVGDGGIVAARCDSSTGPQRGPVDLDGGAERIVPVDRLEVTVAAIDRDVLLAIGAPLCDVAGDAMVTVELARAGRQSFVGGGYVHRPPTGRPPMWMPDGTLHPEIFERFMHFRTDLLDPVPAPGSGAPPPRESEARDPVRAHHAWLAAPEGLDRQLGLARSLRALDRPGEAASMLWGIDLSALPEADLRDVAGLLRFNGQLLLERQLLDLRPGVFADEIAELDDLLERAPRSWLPEQWTADA
ncbi:MAG: hypothetical protein AAGA99_18655 [Actinomycetota bacterium]